MISISEILNNSTKTGLYLEGGSRGRKRVYCEREGGKAEVTGGEEGGKTINILY